MFGLWLILNVLDLFDIALFLLIAFEAVVDAGGGSGGVTEEGLKS